MLINEHFAKLALQLGIYRLYRFKCWSIKLCEYKFSLLVMNFGTPSLIYENMIQIFLKICITVGIYLIEIFFAETFKGCEKKLYAATWSESEYTSTYCCSWREKRKSPNSNATSASLKCNDPRWDWKSSINCWPNTCTTPTGPVRCLAWLCVCYHVLLTTLIMLPPRFSRWL